MTFRIGLPAVALVFLAVAAPLHAADPLPVPQFHVDPSWPRPLPRNYVLGEVGGIFVDGRDHVWIINRPRTVPQDRACSSPAADPAQHCVPAPPVIEFDESGDFIQGWGGPGPGYQWPENEHGIFVDAKRNVWLGGNGEQDDQVLKFTSAGKFLLQIGHAGKSRGSLDTANLNRPAQPFFDAGTNEVFVADGYGNRRVAVFDADSGAFKRLWGAYGSKPDDQASRHRVFEGPGAAQFNLVHSLRISKDNLVYVADRQNNRLQVFTPDGHFVTEAFVARNVRGSYGTVFDLAFSPDPEQRYVYVADGGGVRIHVLDRASLATIGSFGHAGSATGQWSLLHCIAVDSKGNIYTGEVTGARVQKFAYDGVSQSSVTR